MNHFLLPGMKTPGEAQATQSYGIYLMEVLVNELLKRGGRRERLEANLFGGAKMIPGLADVGAKNAEFAVNFLKAEGIGYKGGSLRGEQGRRVHFWPTTGRARQKFVQGHEPSKPVGRVAKPLDVSSGDVELF